MEFDMGDIVKIKDGVVRAYDGYYGTVVRLAKGSLSGSYGVTIPLGDGHADRLAFRPHELELIVKARTEEQK